MSRKLLALTVLQPFATAIVSWGEAGRERFRTVVGDYLSGLPHSAIVGVGRMAGFDDRPAGWSPWAHPEQHHWRFDAVVPFGKPLPCKGAQGLWTVPDDVASACRLSFALDRANLRVYP